MPCAVGVSFRVEIPIQPVLGKEVFTQWLLKNGRVQTAEVVNDVHVITFDANKFVRQDSILRSLRTAFKKKNLLGESVHLTTVPMTAARTTAQRVVQLEENQQHLMEELQRLRMIEPTIVNNNLIILNFGNEDMSYLRPPQEYLENALQGMRVLLDDLYFNKEKPQNHTIRINVFSKTAEVSVNGGWKQIAIPEAACKMIGKCGEYMLTGFNADVHKKNDRVMDFTCSLHSPGEGQSEPLKKEIHHKLLLQSRET